MRLILLCLLSCFVLTTACNHVQDQGAKRTAIDVRALPGVPESSCAVTTPFTGNGVMNRIVKLDGNFDGFALVSVTHRQIGDFLGPATIGMKVPVDLVEGLSEGDLVRLYFTCFPKRPPWYTGITDPERRAKYLGLFRIERMKDFSGKSNDLTGRAGGD